MTRRPTKETTAGQCYLALQREGRRTGRPTDELIQLYALEGFLDRLTKSQYAENFVLKGGVLLAALDARRPTRDIDFAARRLANDTTLVLTAIREIGAIRIDDGLTFGADEATGETIRVNRIEGPSRIFDRPRPRCIICRSSHRRRGSAWNVECSPEALGAPLMPQTSAKACTDTHIRRFCRSISELRKGLIRLIKT